MGHFVGSDRGDVAIARWISGVRELRLALSFLSIRVTSLVSHIIEPGLDTCNGYDRMLFPEFTHVS
jgi:hypothetical protein